MQFRKQLKKDLAPRARFELATLRLTARECKTLNAFYGVAYREKTAIFGPSVGLLGLPVRLTKIVADRVSACEAPPSRVPDTVTSTNGAFFVQVVERIGTDIYFSD